MAQFDTTRETESVRAGRLLILVEIAMDASEFGRVGAATQQIGKPHFSLTPTALIAQSAPR
jgi:hypothetical protein